MMQLFYICLVQIYATSAKIWISLDMEEVLFMEVGYIECWPTYLKSLCNAFQF